MFRLVSVPTYNDKWLDKVDSYVDLAIVEQLLQTDNYLHTVIKGDGDYMLYFDIDGYQNIDAFINDITIYLNKNYHIKLINSDFCYTQNDYHTDKYHVTVPSIYGTPKEQKAIREGFVKEYPIYAKAYDTCVYCNNRLFRMPNQSKGIAGNTGVHRIIRGSMSDFILENIGDINIMDNVPDLSDSESDTDSNIVSNTSKIEKLLDLLPKEYYNDYELWTKIGMIIKNELGEEGINIFDKFSKKSKKKYTSYSDIKKKYRSFKPDGGLTIASLVHYCQIERPKLYAKYEEEEKQKHIEEKIKELRKEYIKQYKFDFSDGYHINIFKEQYNDKKYDSIEEFIHYTFDDLKRVCCYISDIDAFVVKSVSNIVEYKKLKNIMPKNYRLTKAGYIPINWDDIIASNINLTYNSMDYILEHKEQSYIFNRWQGYNAKIIDNPDQTIIDAVLDIIRNVFADGDELLYKYILHWFANLVQSPERNNIALVMISDQGVGKGNFLELIQLIMGVHCCDTSITGISSITQKHNTIIDGKRLIVINEMSSTREEFKSNFDKIKAYITDSYINIEPKGFKPYRATNIGNYIMVSNHEDSIVIEDTDRRYQVFRCSNIYRNNTEFWKKWRNLCLTENGANSFYTYLMSIKDNYDITKIIDTPLKQEMKIRSLPSTVRFIMEYNKTGEIMAHQLYYDYTQWCDRNGERKFSNTKFGVDIKSYTTKDRKNSGIYYIFQ